MCLYVSQVSFFICCSPSHFECHLFLEEITSVVLQNVPHFYLADYLIFCHLPCPLSLFSVTQKLDAGFLCLEGGSGSPGWGVCSPVQHNRKHVTVLRLECGFGTGSCHRVPTNFYLRSQDPLTIAAQIHYFIRADEMST